MSLKVIQIGDGDCLDFSATSSSFLVKHYNTGLHITVEDIVNEL